MKTLGDKVVFEASDNRKDIKLKVEEIVGAVVKEGLGPDAFSGENLIQAYNRAKEEAGIPANGFLDFYGVCCRKWDKQVAPHFARSRRVVWWQRRGEKIRDVVFRPLKLAILGRN